MVKLKKKQASNYEDKYLYIYKRCQNYSDFKKNLYDMKSIFLYFRLSFWPLFFLLFFCPLLFYLVLLC